MNYSIGRYDERFLTRVFQELHEAEVILEKIDYNLEVIQGETARDGNKKKSREAFKELMDIKDHLPEWENYKRLRASLFRLLSCMDSSIIYSDCRLYMRKLDFNKIYQEVVAATDTPMKLSA